MITGLRTDRWGWALDVAVGTVRRDVARLVRRPSRLVGAMAPALLMWGLLGSGMGGTFMRDGGPGGYGAFLGPGMVALVAMFASVFAAIALIEDRHSGFLRAAMVSPTARPVAAMARVASGVLVAGVQAGLCLAPMALLGVQAGATDWLAALAFLAAISAGITGVSLALAWRVDSVSGFHGIMNAVLMPMWLLSGSFFDSSSAPAWLRWLVAINPLSWPIRGLRRSLEDGAWAVGWAEWAGAAAFGAAGMMGAILVIGRERRSG